MSEAERHEFIVTANISDGKWDVDKLLAQYDIKEMQEYLDLEDFDRLFGKEIDIASKLKKDDDHQTDDDPQDSNESKVGIAYLLGSNSLICGDVEQTDKIRQFYAKEILKTDDWKGATPSL